MAVVAAAGQAAVGPVAGSHTKSSLTFSELFVYSALSNG